MFSILRKTVLAILLVQCHLSLVTPTPVELDVVAPVVPTLEELEASLHEMFPDQSFPELERPFNLLNMCFSIPFLNICPPSVTISLSAGGTVTQTISLSTVTVTAVAATTTVGTATQTITQTTATSTVTLPTPTSSLPTSTGTVTSTVSPSIVTVTLHGPTVGESATVTVQPNPATITIKPTSTSTASANVVVTVTPATTTVYGTTVFNTLNVGPTATVYVDNNGNPIPRPQKMTEAFEGIEIVPTAASVWNEHPHATMYLPPIGNLDAGELEMIA